MPKLSHFASTGEMETVVIYFPESSRHSGPNSWDSQSPAHHKRQAAAEAILSDSDDDQSLAIAAEESTASDAPPQATSIPVGLLESSSCFASLNSCVNATGNCSGHGSCEDILVGRDDDGNRLPSKDDGLACFQCQCKGTRGDTGSVTHWAGNRCQKVDYSVPFTLFLGTGILLVSITAGAVTLLYTIGEQPLPGVLGAGVSKKN